MIHVYDPASSNFADHIPIRKKTLLILMTKWPSSKIINPAVLFSEMYKPCNQGDCVTYDIAVLWIK